MKLVNLPKIEHETVEVSSSLGGGMQRVAGRGTSTDVEIVVPDSDNDQINVWNTLKYGPIPDLADAMYKHSKIQQVAFPDDGLILYGVQPYEMQRTQIWDGRVFKCRVDYFEITDPWKMLKK